MYTCSMLPPASLAYLDALGIDVWVRRELASQVASNERLAEAPASRGGRPAVDEGSRAGTLAEPARKREAETDIAAERTPAGEPPVAFTIRCVRFGRVLALIDESLWGERRFFLDVARAMHGPGRVEREISRFDWPQLKSADAGMRAAGRAFRAYLETQVVDGTRVLAAGERVRELAGADFDAHICLDGALRGLTEKKSLWRRIQKLN